MVRNKDKDTKQQKSDDENSINLHEIPFGPFLALGCFVGMLYGQQIINWYLSLF